MNDCFICTKHQHLGDYTGEILLEREGLTLTHFPYLPDEKATKGHLIIEPKRHITEPEEMTDQETAALGSMIKDGTRLIKTKLGAEHVYLFRINDKVKHLHFHLVPRYPGTPRENWGMQIFHWPDSPKLSSLNEIKALASTLRF